jgi:hypothetical protein
MSPNLDWIWKKVYIPSSDFSFLGANFLPSTCCSSSCFLVLYCSPTFSSHPLCVSPFFFFFLIFRFFSLSQVVRFRLSVMQYVTSVHVCWFPIITLFPSLLSNQRLVGVQVHGARSSVVQTFHRLPLFFFPSHCIWTLTQAAELVVSAVCVFSFLQFVSLCCGHSSGSFDE